MAGPQAVFNAMLVHGIPQRLAVSAHQRMVAAASGIE